MVGCCKVSVDHLVSCVADSGIFNIRVPRNKDKSTKGFAFVYVKGESAAEVTRLALLEVGGSQD